jgi:alcohol dehydrogenase (NADP+)
MSVLTRAYAALSATSPLAPLTIERREPSATDVAVDILFCGVCHSDLHQSRNEWGLSNYPVVPGHEIVGRVREVGTRVSRFKQGDLVAVGVLYDSCRACTNCKAGIEQYCLEGATETYNSKDRKHGGITRGGYSEAIVVDEAYVFRVPDNLDPAAVAPLMCAGITTYSPLTHWNVGPSQKVGIVGLGGLGHMAVKFAHALGAHTVLFTTSPAKAVDARRLGADEIIVSKNPEEMNAHAGSFDFILDCVAAEHDINAYLNLLKSEGTLVLVGLPETPLAISAFGLALGRRSLAGSYIGGIAETQQMLDFCGKHNIVSEVEIIRMNEINESYERLLKGDVKFRFVIDMASIHDPAR